MSWKTSWRAHYLAGQAHDGHQLSFICSSDYAVSKVKGSLEPGKQFP